MYKKFFLLLLISSPFWLKAQKSQNPDHLIQFSGLVVTEDKNGEAVPLPYTTVAIKGTNRGSFSEIDGFFSLVAAVGDTMVFSRIGYKTSEHVVSDTLTENFYSWYQVMSADNILLPEAVIYPWPDREHYKIEFLALDVTNELRERAEENLAAEILERMQSAVTPDGANAYEIEQLKRQQEIITTGQFKTSKLFDVIAWSKFIKAWKNGDFKKKKKDKKK